MKYDFFKIKKRDGSKVAFEIEKIAEAIKKAFAALNLEVSNETIERIMSHLKLCNEMSVEDVQNQAL